MKQRPPAEAALSAKEAIADAQRDRIAANADDPPAAGRR